MLIYFSITMRLLIVLYIPNWITIVLKCMPFLFFANGFFLFVWLYVFKFNLAGLSYANIYNQNLMYLIKYFSVGLCIQIYPLLLIKRVITAVMHTHMSTTHRTYSSQFITGVRNRITCCVHFLCKTSLRKL